ncbi:hypothetical protein KIN20_022716 [Parelaphostrongylus tenuis]|uniref:Uncharacterized protein n=1 Tax=Parelaphostrongylus tenuis TaxID=148309 RepID=A0AAD5MQN5_PARTN|nr:hypothetical protein KIN20_022716 [Parelaphostrongylus tenuis]
MTGGRARTENSKLDMKAVASKSTIRPMKLHSSSDSNKVTTKAKTHIKDERLRRIDSNRWL